MHRIILSFTLSQDRFRKQSCSAYPTSLRWTAVNCSYIIWKILHALSCTYIIPTFHVTLGGKWALQQHLQHAEQACRVSVVSRVIFKILKPYRALTVSSKPVHGSTLQIPRVEEFAASNDGEYCNSPSALFKSCAKKTSSERAAAKRLFDVAWISYAVPLRQLRWIMTLAHVIATLATRSR